MLVLYSSNTGIKSEAMLLAAFKYVIMYNYMCILHIYNDELFSETSIEPLDPPSGSKPGDRVYAEGYDKLGGTYCSYDSICILASVPTILCKYSHGIHSSVNAQLTDIKYRIVGLSQKSSNA